MTGTTQRQLTEAEQAAKAAAEAQAKDADAKAQAAIDAEAKASKPKASTKRYAAFDLTYSKYVGGVRDTKAEAAKIAKTITDAGRDAEVREV